MVSVTDLLSHILQVLRAIGSGSIRRFVPVIFVLATEAPYERHALHFSFKIHQCRNLNLSYLTPQYTRKIRQFRRRHASSSKNNYKANRHFSTTRDGAVEFHYETEWLYTFMNTDQQKYTSEEHSQKTLVIRKNISQLK